MMSGGWGRQLPAKHTQGRKAGVTLRLEGGLQALIVVEGFVDVVGVFGSFCVMHVCVPQCWIPSRKLHSPVCHKLPAQQ